jgi:hypothetical protein
MRIIGVEPRLYARTAPVIVGFDTDDPTVARVLSSKPMSGTTDDKIIQWKIALGDAMDMFKPDVMVVVNERWKGEGASSYIPELVGVIYKVAESRNIFAFTVQPDITGTEGTRGVKLIPMQNRFGEEQPVELRCTPTLSAILKSVDMFLSVAKLTGDRNEADQ